MHYEYAHGGDIYGQNGEKNAAIVDFSANINPLGMPGEAIEAAKDAVIQANIYPDSDCRALCAKLGGFENIGKAGIFCSNGASDILFRLAYAAKPKKILVTAPSFADYERAGKAAGAEVIYYALKKENNFQIEEDIADLVVSEAPDIVFICNPNNPTGNLTEFCAAEKIAAACSSVGSILLVDECFLDFVEDPGAYSAKPLTGRYSNIVILKAFTKIFAMPGLRLGYAICADAGLVGRLRFAGPDWAVSNLAQMAGIAALRHGGAYMEATREYVKKEREYISRELARAGLTVYPAYANFIFFSCPGDIDLCGELLKKGIMIRNCENFSGLGPGHYRTAVLSHEKNELLVRAIREVKTLWQNR